MVLTELVQTAGYGHHKAKLIAESEVERRRILKARAKILDDIHSATAEVSAGDVLLNQLNLLSRMDRYGMLATSSRKRLFRQIKGEPS